MGSDSAWAIFAVLALLVLGGVALALWRRHGSKRATPPTSREGAADGRMGRSGATGGKDAVGRRDVDERDRATDDERTPWPAGSAATAQPPPLPREPRPMSDTDELQDPYGGRGESRSNEVELDPDVERHLRALEREDDILDEERDRFDRGV